MDPVVEALKQFLGEYMVAVLVLGMALVALGWWLASKYHAIKTKLAGIDSLPCKTHGDRLDSHDTQFSDTRAILSRMEGQLEILVANAIEKGNRKIRDKSGALFSAKHSPRKLNDNGLALLRDSGGEEFLDRYKDYFISKIERFNPKAALDVEDMALAVLQTSTSEDIFIPLKNWVYNASTRELTDSEGNSRNKEIDLDDILYVISLPLRDLYLEAHSDLKQ